MKALIRWVALALAVSSLGACVVVPGGYYRHDRYYGPPQRYHYDRGYERGYGRPGWGAADVPEDAVVASAAEVSPPTAAEAAPLMR
jgi:hypothetical protein